MNRRDLAYAAGIGVAAATLVQAWRRARRRRTVGVDADVASTAWSATRGAVRGLRRPRRALKGDAALAARIREALQTACATTVDVSVFGGQVSLSGPIHRRYVDAVLRAAHSVPGILGVENALDVTEDLAAPAPPVRRRMDQWTASGRLLAGAGGAALCLASLRRFGLLGLPPAMVGAAAVSRAVVNRSLRRLAGVKRSGGSVDLFHSVDVAVPPDVAYDFWADLSDVPRFLHHAGSLRQTAEREWQWEFRAPAAALPAWRVWLTESVPGKLIAWESAPGAPIASSGIVHFEDRGDGTTRMTVRLAYGTPPRGARLPIRAIFGRVPNRQFRTDLQRMKTYLETGHAARDAVRP